MNDDATSRWRQAHRIQALNDTIAVLRAGADALALENLELRLELAELRGRRSPARLSAATRAAHSIRRR